jgi:hypothetical protein
VAGQRWFPPQRCANLAGLGRATEATDKAALRCETGGASADDPLLVAPLSPRASAVLRLKAHFADPVLRSTRDVR